jgi:hypothetical protein
MCMRRGGVALLVVIVGVLATTPTSACAAGWLAPVNAATSPVGGLGATAQFGLDAQGDATAVWTKYSNNPTYNQFARSVVVASRPFGGSWSAAAPISPPDQEAWSPQIAVNAAGDAVVAWGRWDFQEPGMLLALATRPADGAWSDPVIISSGASSGWQIAIDEDGDATAIWNEYHEGVYGIRSATKPAGANWGSPVTLTSKGDEGDENPHLVLGPAGEATACWFVYREEEEWILQTKTRPVGGAWQSEPTTISDTAGSCQLATGSDGEVDMALVDRATETGTIEVLRKQAGGEWSAPVAISGDDDASRPRIAVDPQGLATATWAAFGPDGYRVRSSSRDAAGAWSQPVELSSPDGTNTPWDGPTPQLVVDQDGNATASWRVLAGPDVYPYGGEYFQLRAARRPAGGAWTPAVDLSPVHEYLDSAPLAVDPHGYVTAIWRQRGDFIRTRVFDPVAPELRDLAMSETGVVGEMLEMSVDPFDVWPPVTTAWDFGDGGTASGPAVSHCYSTPGERTVSVTGTDGAANETSTSQTITIEPHPDLAADPSPCKPPEPPQLTSTDPASPALSNTPRILGTAEAGSTVRIYAGSTCTGSPVATGSAGELVSPGIPVQAAEGFTAVFSATATDPSANTSDCSEPISYTRLKAPEGPGEGGGNSGPTDEGKGPDPSSSSSCTVPKLKGMTLAQAKAALKLAACGLGTVRRPRPRKGRHLPPLVVRSSAPAAGAKLVGGTVDLTLGPKPRKAHGH